MFLLVYYDRLYETEEEQAMVNLYLISISMLPVFIMNAQIYRVYVALAYMSLPAVPYILKAFRLRTKRREYFVVSASYYLYYIAFAGMFFSRMIATHNISYVPFMFFWQV